MGEKIEKYHRVSLRLQGYNYASVGSYFITICTQGRECLFGKITDGQMQMNKFGNIVRSECLKTSTIRPNIELDKFVVMPNHIHGIIVMNNSRRGTACPAPTLECFGKPVSGSIPTIIRSFKSAIMKQINTLCNIRNLSIWQRGYYDHIIRDDIDLNRIRAYIQNNSLMWGRDENNLEKDKFQSL